MPLHRSLSSILDECTRRTLRCAKQVIGLFSENGVGSGSRGVFYSEVLVPRVDEAFERSLEGTPEVLVAHDQYFVQLHPSTFEKHEHILELYRRTLVDRIMALGTSLYHGQQRIDFPTDPTPRFAADDAIPPGDAEVSTSPSGEYGAAPARVTVDAPLRLAGRWRYRRGRGLRPGIRWRADRDRQGRPQVPPDSNTAHEPQAGLCVLGCPGLVDRRRLA
ncbi:MAG: hypothetical protein H0V51_23695 [Chloroflexi bacterium]|nr:hypothetical protein [Chloroflexota bacterium]